MQINLTTFEKVVSPKFTETGGFKLQQSGILSAEFKGQYGLEPANGDASWSTLAWEDGSTRNTVDVIPKTQITYAGAEINVDTMNYDGLSIWFKLKNAPGY